jgi:hypothetical protein
MTQAFRFARLGDAKVLTRGGSLTFIENQVLPADQPMA